MTYLVTYIDLYRVSQNGSSLNVNTTSVWQNIHLHILVNHFLQAEPFLTVITCCEVGLHYLLNFEDVQYKV